MSNSPAGPVIPSHIICPILFWCFVLKDLEKEWLQCAHYFLYLSHSSAQPRIILDYKGLNLSGMFTCGTGVFVPNLNLKGSRFSSLAQMCHLFSRSSLAPSLPPSLPPDLSRVKLMRYEDPMVGPRKVPILGREEEGKLPVSSTSVFNVDLEMKKVTLADNGVNVDIGSSMVYLLE